MSKMYKCPECESNYISKDVEPESLCKWCQEESLEHAKIKGLESRLKEAEEVIGFYGQKESWRCHDEAGPFIKDTDHEKINFEDDPNEEYLWITIGGKRARSYLAKYSKEG